MSDDKKRYLKLDSVDFGIVGFGAGCGTSAFVVRISETEDESEALAYEKFKALAERDYAKQYSEVLNGSQKFHVYFVGSATSKLEHAKQFEEFLTLFSRESVTKQSLSRPDQLRPPFIVWYGEPKHITNGWGGQMLTFYENFNFVVAEVNSATPDLPLREICNHKFYGLVVRAKTSDDLDFLNGMQVKPAHVYVIDENSEGNLELQKMTAKTGFRYFRKQSGGLYALS